jgi:glycosidase
LFYAIVYEFLLTFRARCTETITKSPSTRYYPDYSEIQRPIGCPWGTKEQNGIGRFSDFTDKAIEEIKDLGVSHIWLTGVLHHALIGDYKNVGISDDDPDVVKGRAGSPYAIKDYYAVNPDLSDDPANRNEEFRALVEKIHNQGLKVIIDIVPNHVARKYESICKPEGIPDLGEQDDHSKEYHRDNNFYYIPGQHFQVPDFEKGYEPLGGEDHPLSDGKFDEYPAKWTGNGSRDPKPGATDWYETVKLNYGVKPDGSWDFDYLPDEFRIKDLKDHFHFWQNRSVPDTWSKMKDIALYWLDCGVDGFRYDMAEMVPVPFWSYLNAHIKSKAPDTICIAEIYDPSRYNDFIELGLMDYLYDKVDLYDTLRDIISGNKDCHQVFPSFDKHYAISDHLLHFMENHDEHRIAAEQFAGKAEYAKPAMVLSACLSKGALMIYNGQEVGEPAIENAGFGSSGRTSIFDYIGIPMHQKWMNNGMFDGKDLSPDAKDLRSYYRSLLKFTLQNNALTGAFYDLHRHNSTSNNAYPGSHIYSFARWNDEDKLLILSNFDKQNNFNFRFYLYYDLVKIWSMKPGTYRFKDYFSQKDFPLYITEDTAFIDIQIDALQSLILKFQNK